MRRENEIRLMLVDDHPVVRDVLEMLLAREQGIEIVSTCASGWAAVSQCDRAAPDVVVMDLSRPAMDGTSATRMIRQRHPETQVLVLTSFLEEALLRDALEAGACGYLLKTVSRDELAAAVRAAALGRPTVDPATLPLLFRTRQQRSGDDLTGRERDVLARLVTGRVNREMAQDLGISPGTVRVCVSNILAKLHVANRTEAAVAAVQHGLVRPRSRSRCRVRPASSAERQRARSEHRWTPRAIDEVMCRLRPGTAYADRHRPAPALPRWRRSRCSRRWGSRRRGRAASMDRQVRLRPVTECRRQ